MADVNIDIQTNASALEAQLDGIVSKLGSLSSSGGSAGSALESGFNKGASAVTNAAGEANKFGEVLQGVGAHSRTVAMGLDAMGLSAEGSAAKVGGLVDVLAGLSDAVPQLLAVAAALAAIFGTFEFLKDAIGTAATLQSHMAELGNTIAAQGGNWKALQPQVEAYMEAMERVTSFSKDQMATALQAFAAAGMSVATSEKSLTAAMQISAATGKDLSTVQSALIRAYDGSTVGLTRLGVATKEQIKDAGDYSNVLAVLTANTKGAAEAQAATFAGSLEQLHNVFDSLMQDIGAPFLSALSAIAQGFAQVIEAVDDGIRPSLEQFGEWVASQIPAIVSDFQQIAAWVASNMPGIIQAFGNLKQTLQDVGDDFKTYVLPALSQAADSFSTLTGKVSDNTGQVDDNLTSWQNIREALKEVNQLIGYAIDAFNMIKTVFDAVKAPADFIAQTLTAIAIAAAGAAVAVDNLARSLLHLPQNQYTAALFGNGVTGGDDLPVGPKYNAGGGSTPGGIPPIPPGADTHDTGGQAPTTAGAKAKKASGAVYDTPPDMSDVMEADTDAAKALLDALKDLPQTVAGFSEQLAELGPMLQASKDDQATLTQAVADSKAKFEDARTTYNTYKDSIGQGVAPTQGQAAALKILKEQADAAEKSYSTLNGQLKTSTADTQELTNAYTKAAEGLDKAQNAWTDFMSKTDAQARESLATFDMTNQQKVTYYQQMVAKLTADFNNYAQQEIAANKALDDAKASQDADQIAKAQANLDKIVAAEKAADAEREADYKKMVDAEVAMQQQAVDTEKQYVSTFLTDIIADHKSLADTLQDIYQEILKNFIAMITKMIVESKLFQQVAGWFMGGNSGGGWGNDAGSPGNNGDSGGGWGADNGSGDVGGIGGGAPDGGDTARTKHSRTFGSNSKSNSSNAMDANNPGATAQWTSNLSDATKQSPLTVTPDPNATTTSGGGFGGSSIGDNTSTGAGGGQSNIWGNVGGTVGGIAGSIFGGPVGGMIGSVLGSLIGGLFGNHTPISDMPDVGEPVVDGMSYGQWVSDFTGHNSTENGQVYAPDPQYNVPAGGTSMTADVETDLLNIMKDPSSFSQPIQDAAKALEALNPNNVANGWGIAFEKNGMFTLNDGEQVNVEQYMQETQGLIGLMGSQLGPEQVFKILNSAPNFNDPTLKYGGTYQNGVYTPPGKTPPGTTPPGTTPPPGGGTPPVTGGPGSHPIGSQPQTVNVNVYLPVGAYIGTTSQLAQQLAQPLSEAMSQTVFSNKYNMRFRQTPYG